MIYKDVKEITRQDFQLLIDNGVAESRVIEYKAELNIEGDSERKEFLYDVSSFANSSGGDLIFGISEDSTTGLPSELKGLNIKNIDELKLKVDNLIRDGVAPRIAGVQVHSLPLSESNHILLIRIPKSWNSPHQVIFKNADRFYTRASNGKYKLNVDELRAAFLASDTITDRLRKFREDRLSKVISNEAPVLLKKSAKIVLQLIPLSSFEPNKIYDISSNKIQPSELYPLGGGGWEYKYNLDGILGVAGSRTGDYESYIQLFRNGIIETVNAEILLPYDGKSFIPNYRVLDYESKIIDALTEYYKVIKLLQIELPIYLYLSMTGVKDYFLGSSRYQQRYGEPNKVDREVIALPEIVLENLDASPRKILKPAFDMIWNACGYERSGNYGQDGEWIGPKS